MNYLSLNKENLTNLEYSLKREFLETNRKGGYASSTVICCNTRKYHGLLVLPVKKFGGANYVFLSGIDETVVENGKAFNLSIHKYPETYDPRGHKYIVDFSYEPVFGLTYTVGDIKLKKEILMERENPRIMIRYTVLEAGNSFVFRIKPFLAFREIHSLSKANMDVDTNYKNIAGGIKSRMYKGFPELSMQIDRKNEFIPNPDWYYNIEYEEERNRGYEYSEDLFVPGYFELKVKKGASFIFAAGTEDISPSSLKKNFEKYGEFPYPKNNFKNCLKYSASQFIVEREDKTEVIAGFPWFDRWGRDTFIALPGLTLGSEKNLRDCKAVIDTMVKEMKNGLFPNIGKNKNAAYNSVDAPLWFFWTLMKYEKAAGDKVSVWEEYGRKMKAVLNAYRYSKNPYARMDSNGLIRSGAEGKALTWMDAVVNGHPVTPRNGYAVEINALWYNAVCYSLAAAEKAGNRNFVKKWEELPDRIAENFRKTFWMEEKEYLADYVDENGQNDYIRPNQILACSLEYSPISDREKLKVIDIVKAHLLTPKGLRTLSPQNPHYIGIYEGNQEERDKAYHQGCVWPWLLGHYIEANFRIMGKDFVEEARDLIKSFEENITTYCICSIAEIYDGNPPHHPGGAISQAWSVGEILRCIDLTESIENA